MKQLKIIPLFCLQILFNVSYSQTGTIDSLKKVLPALKDSARIDCLNDLSREYVQKEKKDSAVYFAGLAMQESKKINYTHGIAVTLTSQARIVKHFDDDFVQSEKLGKESLTWFEKTLNKEGITDTYHELAVSLHAQSRFEETAAYNLKLYEHYKIKGNTDDLSSVLAVLTVIYKEAGDYEKCFYFIQQCRQLATNTGNQFILQCYLFGLGGLYMKIEDYSSALAAYRQAFAMDNPQFEKRRRDEDWDIWIKMEYAEIFSHLYQFDSAWHYFELYKPASAEDRYFRIYLVSTGEYYLLQKKYNPALQNFLKGLYLHQQLNDRNEIQRSLILIGKTYLARQQYDSAMQYGKRALNVAYTTKAKQVTRDACQIIYTVYDRYKQTDSANLYFRQYSAIKDSVANDQVKAKLAVSNYEQKIELLDKEKELQQQKLKQTAQQKEFLIAGIICLLLLALIIFRMIALKRKHEKQKLEHNLQLQKLESEKVKADLQQQASELEMQALRAQMNPHFIFNSLNSINRFILQNNKSQASEYLTKFSKLVRMILQNSQASLITLENELAALELYLDLEALRFEHHFDYKISVQKDLDIEILKVPPLVIQPFVENAIWHGLMHKEEKGHLDIEIFQQEEILCCRITDDGIGRKKAAELKSKSAPIHKSMGMQITASRIEMLQQKKQLDTYIEITDLALPDGSSGGTEVIIKIPVVQ